MKKQILQRLEIIAKQLLNDQQSWKTEEIKNQVLELYNELVFLEHLEKLIDHNPVSESVETTQKTAAEVENTHSPEEKETTTEDTTKKDENELFEPDFSNDDSNSTKEPELLNEEQPLSEIDDDELSIENQTDTEQKNQNTAIPVQNELELFAASFQAMPEFERKDIAESREKSEDTPSEIKPKESVINKPKSLNDVINKGLNIGLNDRLAFIKHLFEGRSEDYTRVLSQLETFENLDEAMDFLNVTVKPDYNHWETKDDYVLRFVSIIEKRFS